MRTTISPDLDSRLKYHGGGYHKNWHKARVVNINFLASVERIFSFSDFGKRMHNIRCLKNFGLHGHGYLDVEHLGPS